MNGTGGTSARVSRRPVATVAGLPRWLGERITHLVTGVLQFVGDLAVTFARGVPPGNWRRTMREEFQGFFYLVGVRAIPAVLVTALLVGIGLVVQVIYWLEIAGQQGQIGDFLVLMLVREISPVVTALIVIGRSGSVLLDEVGHLRANGQIRMLESHGIDPTDFIAVPRCFATALALFVLTVIFVNAAVWSGYLGSVAAGLTAVSLPEFATEVFSDMTLGDHVLLIIKPTVIGFIIGYIPIWLGLRVEPSVLSVRQTLPRGFVYSLLATFLINVTVSLVL